MFEKVAGPRLNKDKTVMMWMGNVNEGWDLKQYGLVWTEKPIKYLGHFIFKDSNTALETEWSNKLAKLQSILNNWKKRNLTIFGKVTIFKSLALSQIIHVINVDSIPLKFLHELNKMIFQFIWGSKIEKVKRSTLTEDYINGGIKMIDIQKQMFSFRLKWLGRLLNESQGMWKEMANFWYNKLGGIALLLNCNYNDDISHFVNEKKIPSFYGEVLCAWRIVRPHVQKTHGSGKASEHILWYNQNITLNKRSLFFKYWFEAGILFLKDVVGKKCLISVQGISEKLKSVKGKSNLMFDYMKLKNALPTVWLNQVSEVNETSKGCQSLQIPHLIIRNKKKSVSELSSKCFYRLTLLNCRPMYTNYCCLFWENRFKVDIAWSHVFKRYLICTKENRLLQFNFKLIYDLLPVRTNLFKWGLANESNFRIATKKKT